MTGAGGSPAFCQLCGRPLNERSRRFHHPAWSPELSLHVCANCVAHKPRCPVCHMPGNTAGACPTCRAVGPICVGCGRRPRRRAVHFGHNGPYCADCAAGPRCHSCGLPVGGDRASGDGRPVCAACRATAVVSADEANRVYRAAEDIIREQLGLSLNVPTGLTLVEPDELSTVLRDMGQDPDSGGETLGVYTRRGRRRGIYAAVGLPRLLLLQVAAHELAHAWQMESAPLLRDPLLREGFAEWVAYRVLLAVGEQDAAQRIVAREDLYGQGARLLLGIEEEAGPRGVIEWTRRAR